MNIINIVHNKSYYKFVLNHNQSKMDEKQAT